MTARGEVVAGYVASKWRHSWHSDDVCAGLGYGSASDSDDDNDNAGHTSLTDHKSSAAESSDDDDLFDRIRRKKLEFERKMRELEERDNCEQTLLCAQICFR